MARKQPVANPDTLRVSYVMRRADVPRIEWMMKVARQPSKVDLIRAALNHFEEYLIDQAAARAERRKLAGAPD